jgi:UDP-N-acetylmuramoyl-tripeptide--D-alanyl-D-alanine ligase
MKTVWSAQEVAQAVGAKTTGTWVATGVGKDSRELKSGDLFVALKGPKVEGSDYVAAAFEAGAVGAIVDRIPLGFEGDSRLICVNDTLKALNDLANAARTRSQAKVVAITGSFGKTGTKDAAALLLAHFGSVHASERSFNNHWGVPFTVSNIGPKLDFAVIEMGMNHAGEIAPLSQIARPHVALITTIREMHIEHLGTLENIAAEKAEIFAGMAEGGTVVLNRDDLMFPQVAAKANAKKLKIITFGSHQDADCRLIKCMMDEGWLWAEAMVEGTIFSYRIPVAGEHWALNSLGVLGIIKALGLDVIEASKAFLNMVLPEGRGVQHQVKLDHGYITVIDESYNAGPDSMRAALKVLGALVPQGAGRRIAILGDMRELGPQAQEIHEGLKTDLIANKVDLVFTCGEKMEHLHRSLPESMRGAHTLDLNDLVSTVTRCVQAGDIFMIKGSKGQYAHRGRMYAFVEALLKLGFEETVVGI